VLAAHPLVAEPLQFAELLVVGPALGLRRIKAA
jgi:hypothetical protein